MQHQDTAIRLGALNGRLNICAVIGLAAVTFCDREVTRAPLRVGYLLPIALPTGEVL